MEKSIKEYLWSTGSAKEEAEKGLLQMCLEPCYKEADHYHRAVFDSHFGAHT